MTDAVELALVADELPVAIWLGRVPSGEVVYTNAAFREVLGIEPPEGAARGGFVEPYGVHTPTGEPYPEDQMPFERVLATRATAVVDDLVIHRRDGRHVFLRVLAKPIFDAKGEITHVLEAFTDITREVEAERARVESERRLARSQRLESIGQLVGGIAHDFNNLLTVIKLEISWLQSRMKDEGHREALQQIDTVSDSVSDLIKNLLGFVRRERHNAVPLSLDSAVTPVLEMAIRTFDPRITVRSELDASDALILGDVSQLEQMAMNLVINARDAITGSGELVMASRTHVIETSAAGSRPPGAYVVLEIADTGCGVDPAIRERIFEPYFTTKTQGSVKGTGLGLSIVHGIIAAHGGFIDVEDNRPAGTVVRVLFPVLGELPRSPDREPASAAVLDPIPRGNGQLILVVDDEPSVLTSTAANLRALDFRVCEAADGAAALALFTAQPHEFAAVVLDMVMPGLRGREVYLGLRARRPDVRVVLVSGCGLDDEAKAILALGVQGWLPKPYDTRQLVATLHGVGAF